MSHFEESVRCILSKKLQLPQGEYGFLSNHQSYTPSGGFGNWMCEQI